MQRLSVIVPAFDEEATIGEVLSRLLDLSPPVSEIVVVDDGSLDGTAAAAAVAVAVTAGGRVRVVRHGRNRGKGAAVRTGLDIVRGDLVVTQDADLEYDPGDLPRLRALFQDPQVAVVYGVRQPSARPSGLWAYAAGARLMNGLTNLLFGARVHDQSTCYKMFRTEVLRGLDLRADGFAYCSEVTAKVLARGYRIHEIPIRYTPRRRSDGKKLTLSKGLWCALALVRWWVGARRARTADSGVGLPGPAVGAPSGVTPAAGVGVPPPALAGTDAATAETPVYAGKEEPWMP